MPAAQQLGLREGPPVIEGGKGEGHERQVFEQAGDEGERLAPLTDPRDRVRGLMEFLFTERGFRGNQEHYYDPLNSCLDQVLVRRIGIPITLSVVAMEVGARLGIGLEGVAFPGHFLVRTTDLAAPLLLDPFHTGSAVDDEELLLRLKVLGQQAGKQPPEFTSVPRDFLATASRPAILARMLRNLASTGALVLGAHFPSRPAGRVVADGDAYRFLAC